jgi:hypothetical protein
MPDQELPKDKFSYFWPWNFRADSTVIKDHKFYSNAPLNDQDVGFFIATHMSSGRPMLSLPKLILPGDTPSTSEEGQATSAKPKDQVADHDKLNKKTASIRGNGSTRRLPPAAPAGPLTVSGRV